MCDQSHEGIISFGFLDVWDSNAAEIPRIEESISITRIEDVLIPVLVGAIVAKRAIRERRRGARCAIAIHHGHIRPIIRVDISLELGFKLGSQYLGLIEVVKVELDHLMNIPIALTPPRIQRYNTLACQIANDRLLDGSNGISDRSRRDGTKIMSIGENRFSGRERSIVFIHGVLQRMLHDVPIPEIPRKPTLEAKVSGTRGTGGVREITPESQIHLLGELVSLLQVEEPVVGELLRPARTLLPYQL